MTKGWYRRGISHVLDRAEWVSPDGMRGVRRPPLWIIALHLIRYGRNGGYG